MVMVVDDATAITGSFHFRAAAQKGNAENLLVLNDPELAAQYLANWGVPARRFRDLCRGGHLSGAFKVAAPSPVSARACWSAWSGA
jgi:phosphatidylserine/phosphatidylglycerophosphate/cardiolipin synthase-like enzyme